MERVVEAFFAAGAATVDVVGSSEVAEAWGEPSALAGYAVGELAAHVLLATARLELVLAEDPPADPVLVDLAGFYGPNRVDDETGPDAGLHPLIRGAAADAATRGPVEVATDLTALVERLRAVLPAADPARLVSVVNVRHGATPLDTYLRTRVVELVVHGDDLAVSVGTRCDIPPPAGEVALLVCLDLARARSGDEAVLRGFTRRERAVPDVLRVL